MSRFKIGVFVLAVAGATIFFAVQNKMQIRLREENLSLRRQIDQIIADNEQLSNSVANATNSFSDAQELELLRLRGQVGVLRQQITEVKTLQTKNLQIQAGLASTKNSKNFQTTNSSPAASPPLFTFQKTSWAFAGYATPEAAFQSLNWAAANGDLNALLDGSTPDQQKQFAKEFENKTESDSANEIKNHINQNTQVSILSEDVHSDNEVVLTVVGDAERNTPANLVFQKINGQWKYAREDH